MSLRVRMGLASGIAVAIAVLAVAVSAYEGTRSELQAQLDRSLQNLAQPILIRAGVIKPPSVIRGRPVGRPGGPFGGPGLDPAGRGGTVAGSGRNDCDDDLGIDLSRGDGFGGAQGYVQLVHRNGSICLAGAETTKIPATASVKALAARGSGHFASDTHVGATQLRMLAYGLGARGALVVALPRSDVDDALSSELVLLGLVAAGGVVLAALLGVLVARTALVPIARFTRDAELIAADPGSIGQRFEHDRFEMVGSDELARLARTFNEMLDALAHSIHAQRNLVADASHELRTPIATIRANLQLMQDEQLLSSEDRDGLRRDVIDELDELTALVGDVVELARGSSLGTDPGEVRLDALVDDAVQRAQRRAPQLRFEASLEPTVVCGDGGRIARAVANLLDNACKWSPQGSSIEIILRDGTLTVRDHGRGFQAEDLPFVFDRFHRAKDARSTSGSGLGLAIVRQVADAHGGFADASNAPGGGAILRVGFGPPLEIEGQDPAADTPTVE